MKKTIHQLEREIKIAKQGLEKVNVSNLEIYDLLRWIHELAEYIKDNEK